MGWFSCLKCTCFAEIIGIGGMAVLIYDNPEDETAIALLEKIYSLCSSKYGEKITKAEFISNAQTLAGELDDIEFCTVFPKRVCSWFGQC